MKETEKIMKNHI